MPKTKLPIMKEGIAILDNNKGMGGLDEVEPRNKQEDSIERGISDISSDSGYSDSTFYGSEDILIDVMRNIYLGNMHKATDHIMNELDKLRTASLNSADLYKEYNTLSRVNPNTIENEDKAVISLISVQLAMDKQIQQILELNEHLKPEDFASLRKEVADFKEVLDKKMFMQGTEVVINNYKKRQVTNELITTLLKDLKSIESFISDELIKVAQNNNGKMMYTADFRSARAALLSASASNEANQGKAVISLEETIRGINKKLDKTLTESKDLLLEGTLIAFKKQVGHLQKALTTQIYTKQGVMELIEKRSIARLFDKVFIMSSDDNNNLIPIHPKIRKDFTEQMTPYINMPKQLMQGILRKDDVSQLEQAINGEIVTRFTKGGDGKTWGILDKDKITAINIVQAISMTNQLLKTAYKLGLVQEPKHVSNQQPNILSPKVLHGKHTQNEMNRRNNRAKNVQQLSK